ncbi:MAG: Thiopurine S-methyltransferase [Nitrosomonas sp.]|nr:Thiopurine S-methyltransferase [Nitrosomonas sp.]
MDNAYWLNRWERQDIGFHQTEINPYLREFWQRLQLSPASAVLVPLCGKSRDMVWLRQQGHTVLGVELSIIAAQAFFTEHALVSLDSACDRFTHLAADGIQVLCGDFFALSREDTAAVSAVYDRAALVALPPDMRRRYVNHLLQVLPPHTQILLITLDYPQHEMTGPPFAVSLDEVAALYRSRAEMTVLSQYDVLAQNPRFQERELSRLEEYVILLKTFAP